jgi:two-component system, OmpR family, response regulator MprA
MKVLLLEDDLNLNKMLCRVLEAEGYQVTCETDSTRLLETLEEIPEIVVMDIMMPHLDGPTVLAALIERGFEGKVVVISGLDEGRRLSQWISADAFLKKPFSGDDLLLTLKGLQKALASS